MAERLALAAQDFQAVTQAVQEERAHCVSELSTARKPAACVCHAPALVLGLDCGDGWLPLHVHLAHQSSELCGQACSCMQLAVRCVWSSGCTMTQAWALLKLPSKTLRGGHSGTLWLHGAVSMYQCSRARTAAGLWQPG